MHEVIKCLFALTYAASSKRPLPLEGSDHFDSHRPIALCSAKFEPVCHASSVLEDEILLDPVIIAHVHHELINIDYEDSASDPLGDLYEAFVGTSVQKNEGQFFTPHAAVDWLVNAVDPRPGREGPRSSLRSRRLSELHG